MILPPNSIGFMVSMWVFLSDSIRSTSNQFTTFSKLSFLMSPNRVYDSSRIPNLTVRFSWFRKLRLLSVASALHCSGTNITWQSASRMVLLMFMPCRLMLLSTRGMIMSV